MLSLFSANARVINTSSLPVPAAKGSAFMAAEGILETRCAALCCENMRVFVYTHEVAASERRIRPCGHLSLGHVGMGWEDESHSHAL